MRLLCLNNKKYFWLIFLLGWGFGVLGFWGFGIGLAAIPDLINWSEAWPWIKLLSVLCMSAFHFWLMRRQNCFEQQNNKISGKTYRIMNEIPTVLLFIIVIMVIIRPF